jgi:hypothetical protein
MSIVPTPPIPDMLDSEFCPSVTIKLGKKEFRLAFTMASVLAFKAKTGRNMFTLEGWSNFSLRDDPEAVLAFFWAALQTYHPQITFDEVLRMANFGNMKLISEKCEEALQVHMPKSESDVGEGTPTTEAPKSIG